MDSEKIYVLRSDGYNFPSVYEYRDIEHANFELCKELLEEKVQELFEVGYVSSEEESELYLLVDSPTLPVTIVK